MKRKRVLLLTIISIFSLTSYVNVSASSEKIENTSKILAEDREHENINTESLLGCLYRDGIYGSSRCYYAYNQYGEMMFSILEQDNEPELSYVNKFNLYNDDNSIDEYQYIMPYDYFLHLDKLHYNSDKELSTCDTYENVCFDGIEVDDTGWVVQIPADEHAKNKKYVAGESKKYNKKIDDYTIQSINKENEEVVSEKIYDEQGRLSVKKYSDIDGNLFIAYEYEYDESGEVTQITGYSPDGTVSNVETEIIQLNSNNQIEYKWTECEGEIIVEEEYEYFYFTEGESFENVDDMEGYWINEHVKNYPLEGYWVGEKDGKEVFLVCSVNWWMCSGVIDPETGLYIIEYYIWAEPDENSFIDGHVADKGVLSCDWTENAREWGRSEKEDLMPDEVSYEVKDDKLIFNGITYERID